MESEGSGAEWGSRLARAQVVIFYCVFGIQIFHVFKYYFFHKFHNVRMRTTASCGQGIASSLTPAIEARRFVIFSDALASLALMIATGSLREDPLELSPPTFGHWKTKYLGR